MNKIHLAVGAMLAAALPALSTGARAAPAFPHAVAAGAAHTDYLLVQGYGGRRDDDDDEPRSQPRMHVQPHYDRPHNNNGAVMQQLLQGIGEAVRRQREHDLQQKYLQQQQELLRQRAIDEQRRRNQAAQQERLRRAKQEQLEKLRQQEQRELQAERDRLRKLQRERQEQIEEEKAAAERRRKQEEYADHPNNNNNSSNNNPPNNNTPNNANNNSPNNANNNNPNNDTPGYPAANSGNNNPTPNDHNNNYPTADNNNNDSYSSELENHVHVTIILVPNDDLPPINVVTPLPVTHDKQLPACGYVSLPADREVCSGRTADGAWLRVVSVPTVGGGSRSVCMSYCQKPPAIHPRPHIVTPTPTVVTPTVVKKLTPAIRTGEAYPTIEPEYKHLTPAIRTGEAYPTIEPEHKHLTPAIRTGEAYPTTEPEHKHLTPAMRTGEAYPTTEPEHKHLTPAMQTAEANSTIEPEHKHLTPAESTGAASPYVEPEHKREPKRRARHGWLTPAVLTPTAASYTEPQRKRPDGNSDAPAFGFDSFEPPPASEKPVPRLAGDGCMGDGTKPLPKFVNDPGSRLRQLAVEGSAIIPKVGDAINFFIDLLWPDNSQDRFAEMKDYVDELVPAAIAKYDSAQLKRDIAVILDDFKRYKITQTASTKGDKLDTLVHDLDVRQPSFLNAQDPKSTLAEFAAFGALHLAALKEAYDHYDLYHPLDPKDPDAARKREADRKSLALSPLQDAITTYKKHIQAIRDDIIADRVAKVQIRQAPKMTWILNPFRAPYDPISLGSYMQLKTADLYSAKDDAFGCNWHLEPHENDRDAAQREVDARQKAVRETYSALLDRLAAPLTVALELAEQPPAKVANRGNKADAR